MLRCDTGGMTTPPDVSYCVVPSKVGELLLAATDAGIVRVAFATEDFDVVLAEIAQLLGSVTQRSTPVLEDAAQQLEAYLAGTRTSFDVPLDLRLVGGFRRQVLDQLDLIPWGERHTYTQVAAAVGSPQAVRAVGTACANNPVPLLLPCHRVVRSDGKAGGYLGGTSAKDFLLRLESA